MQYQLLQSQQQQQPTTTTTATAAVTTTTATTTTLDGALELLLLLQMTQDALQQWFQMINTNEIHRAEVLEEELRRIVESNPKKDEISAMG